MANQKHTKVRDLKPTKDAKGGGPAREGKNTLGGNRLGGDRNTGGTNTKQHLKHGTGGHN